jgi:hypothetical protein
LVPLAVRLKAQAWRAATPIAVGNSDSAAHGAPGTYIPGELGIRHEDTVAVTEEGCENLAPKWSGSPEEPAMM